MSTAGENQRKFQIINQEYFHTITVNESKIMQDLCFNTVIVAHNPRRRHSIDEPPLSKSLST